MIAVLIFQEEANVAARFEGLDVRKDVQRDLQLRTVGEPSRLVSWRLWQQTGALGVSHVRIALKAIPGWERMANLATRTGGETCGRQILEILSGRRSSFSTAILAWLLAF
jgi:hypothetical protein